MKARGENKILERKYNGLTSWSKCKTRAGKRIFKKRAKERKRRPHTSGKHCYYL